MNRSLLFRVFMVIGVAALTLCGLLVRQVVLRGTQVRIFTDMRTMQGFLIEFHDVHGRFPEELAEALPESLERLADGDSWGTGWHYQADGSSFILASYGQGGRKDDLDYGELRSRAASAGRQWSATQVAGSWHADQVVSDLGWLRETAK